MITYEAWAGGVRCGHSHRKLARAEQCAHGFGATPTGEQPVIMAWDTQRGNYRDMYYVVQEATDASNA